MDASRWPTVTIPESAIFFSVPVGCWAPADAQSPVPASSARIAMDDFFIGVSLDWKFGPAPAADAKILRRSQSVVQAPAAGVIGAEHALFRSPRQSARRSTASCAPVRRARRTRPWRWPRRWGPWLLPPRPAAAPRADR